MLIVTTTYAGTNPEDMEELVTSKIEDQISTLSDIQRVTAQSTEGQSMVLIQYEYGQGL